jgi:alkanesulfonate monooxygenase SsuD/methylene tetrahydromethanopterin reductase-like flavin-dependent oxidoreductase (luciferase family)
MRTVLQVAAGAAVPLGEVATVAAVAEEVGVAALRLVDEGALDPTVVAAHLAGLRPGIGLLPEVPTTHHAPYNVARRILSLDRETGGRAGVVLLAGDGDEVSGPSPAGGPVQRWSEYAALLAALWESFPREALIGDQEAGVVVDDSRLRPIGHEGRFYRVAGPLDGPSSVQGRPLLVADLGTLGAGTVTGQASAGAGSRGRADVVVADRTRVIGARAALGPGITLLGRVTVPPLDADASAALGRRLRVWAREHDLDGVELVPRGGPASIVAILRSLVPELTPTPVTGSTSASGPTLREALTLS